MYRGDPRSLTLRIPRNPTSSTVRRVGRANKGYPWYLNSAMGVLAIGGFFVAVGAVQALVTNDQGSSTDDRAGAALALVVGVAAIVGAGAMNAGRAWGWLVGIIVSSVILALGIVALASPSRGLAAIFTLITGILLVVALLHPVSRAIMRGAPPRPDDD
jgi:hypothetical protein